jgi:O-antigen ligase
LVLGFAALYSGGVTAPEWNVCLMAVCALSLAVFLPAPSSNHGPGTVRRSPIFERALGVMLILLPSWAALQLLPLPLSWLRVLSPARADLQNALLPIGLAAGRAPLSAAPALTLAHLLRVLSFICVFFLIRELTRRLTRWPWLTALPVVTIGAAEAAVGLAQYFGGAAKATGTYVNPDHYSCFLQMALPFPLVLAALALRRHGYENGSLKRVLLACALIACAAVIFLGALHSMSRMGVAAIAVSLLVLAICGGMRKNAGRYGYTVTATVAAVFILVIFLSTPGALLERLATQGGAEPLTTDVRVRIWEETLHMSADYRVFGSGLGTYASVFQKYRASSPQYLVDFAHNDYLQLLAELGVIGFGIACVAAIIILGRVIGAVRAGPTTAHRLVAAACAAALAALMLDSSVDFDFYIPANAMLAAWIAGIGTAIGISPAGGRDTVVPAG